MNLGMSEGTIYAACATRYDPGGTTARLQPVSPDRIPAFYDPESDCRSLGAALTGKPPALSSVTSERNDTEIARQYAVALGFDKPPISVPIDNLYAIAA